jgi:hypothetical protein
VETLQEGWNLLLDPAAEDFAEIVSAFRPAGARKPIFGRNVAERMLGIVTSLGSRPRHAGPTRSPRENPTAVE